MNRPDAEHRVEPSTDVPMPDHAAVDRQLRQASRRGFATAGVAILAGYGAWHWLASRPDAAGIPWPLRRGLELNERLTREVFDPARLAPDFVRSRARIPRINGMAGMAAGGFDPATWRLDVAGGALGRGQRLISLDEIRALPRFEQTTELKCIEGWSTIVRWAGVRLADLAASTGLAARSGRAYAPARPPADLYQYVSLATPSGGYYVGLDMPSALHPQTLLCDEMNGQPLSSEHGAPLRLVIPLKYGIKNIKQIGTIQFTDRRPADYWAQRGYDWFAGH